MTGSLIKFFEYGIFLLSLVTVVFGAYSLFTF